MAAYELSGAFTADGARDTLYLTKARELADLLMHAFQTPTGLPLSIVNFKTHKSSNYRFVCLCGIVHLLSPVHSLHGCLYVCMCAFSDVFIHVFYVS